MQDYQMRKQVIQFRVRDEKAVCGHIDRILGLEVSGFLFQVKRYGISPFAYISSPPPPRTWGSFPTVPASRTKGAGYMLQGYNQHF